jgi:hypothetical protein
VAFEADNVVEAEWQKACFHLELVVHCSEGEEVLRFAEGKRSSGPEL